MTEEIYTAYIKLDKFPHDVQVLHQIIMLGFPDLPEEGHARSRMGVLFAVDDDGRIEVRSRVRSDYSDVQCVRKTAFIPCLRSALPDLSVGRQYQFSIVMNPVKRSHTGRLVPVTDPFEVLQWATTKLASEGFKTSNLASSFYSPSDQGMWPVVSGRGGKLVLNARRITGTLTIEDEDKAKRAYVEGIGRAKAFGFGMLDLGWRLAQEGGASGKVGTQ